jgi:hypothetical protein
MKTSHYLGLASSKYQSESRIHFDIVARLEIKSITQDKVIAKAIVPRQYVPDFEAAIDYNPPYSCVIAGSKPLNPANWNMSAELQDKFSSHYNYLLEMTR